MTSYLSASILPVTFAGGDRGEWRVRAVEPVVGPTLPRVDRVAVVEGSPVQHPSVWALRGVVGHGRYVRAAEARALAERSPALGRPEATRAALIPITKSPRWWALAQDERRELLEERSRHIATGLAYLPAVARRLHHGRDLGEPFDFLTWFEFAPADEPAFDDLVAALRDTPEWGYVEREVDIRLER
jgi:chlorite dismutase